MDITEHSLYRQNCTKTEETTAYTMENYVFPIHFDEKNLCVNTIAKIPFKFLYKILKFLSSFLSLGNIRLLSKKNSIEKCTSILEK